MEKMKMESVDGVQKNIEIIEKYFPNCITEDKCTGGGYKKAINFELLKQMLSDELIDGDEAYEFTWVGKKASIVEANKPIRKTLRPYLEESVDWDTTENLYIEGDNLEVLKLLQESYLGKVKMIYIDPPYNTGKDFIYNDDFKMTREEYADEIGELDEDGNRMFKNTDSNGRFHSDWCSMMYSRLMIARMLLSENGAIFISIDDSEQENLKKICDEIFGATNFIAKFIRKGSGGRQDSKYYAIIHEYILCYSKDCEKFISGKIIKNKDKYPYFDKSLNKYYKTQLLRKWGDKSKRSDRPNLYYSIIDPDGDEHYPMLSELEEGRWRWKKETMAQNIEAGLVEFKKQDGRWVAYEKVLEPNEGENKTKLYTTIIDDISNSSGVSLIKSLFNQELFSYPKPVELIKRSMQLGNVGNDDIVMDFFSGSSTTAHAVMQLNAEDGGNRKFIMVQLPEKTDEKSEAYKAGYKNICEIGKERIRRAGRKIKEENPLTTQDLDVGFRVFKLDTSNMKDVYYSPAEYNQNLLSELESNIKSDRNDLDLLFGCLLDRKLPLSLPYSSEEIEGYTIHNYNDGDLVACFDEKVPDNVIQEIAKKKPLRAVFRDSSFVNSPSKVNVEAIFKLMSPDTKIKVI